MVAMEDNSNQDGNGRFRDSAKAEAEAAKPMIGQAPMQARG